MGHALAQVSLPPTPSPRHKTCYSARVGICSAPGRLQTGQGWEGEQASGRRGGEQSHLLGLWKQYSVCLLGMAVLGEASQDGPGQKENKHRFDENVVTPGARRKTPLSWEVGAGGAGKEACGVGQLLPLF